MQLKVLSFLKKVWNIYFFTWTKHKLFLICSIKGSSHNNNETENYYFFVNKWFAKNEDDGQIVRELIATDENGRPLMELNG